MANETETETTPAAAEGADTQPEDKRNRRKTRIALVTSDKMDKTIVVSVTNLVRHPLYGRTVKQTTKFKAHDETNDAHTGDTVEVMETRPLSHDKRWRLNRVVERAK